MYPTKNDIDLSKRKKLTGLLNQLLSEAIDLKAQTKQAHWNVKGEDFIALHQLFDTIATEADDVVDLIAERVVQLGEIARGTVRVAAKQSRLKEYPLDATDSQLHVDALSSAIAAFNAYGRKAIDESDTIGDKVTADLLTGIVRGLDKQLWFVEAHLKETTVKSSRKTG